MFNTIIDFGRLFSIDPSDWSTDRMRDIYLQCFPPPPSFTEAQLPRQDGRVFIITGGNSGIGLALVKLLYPTGAKIYLAARSEAKYKAAVEEVYAEHEASGDTTTTPGSIHYLHLDLADLTTTKASAASFLSRESRLDVLWNNAGVAGCPTGSKTAQGLEIHIGTNCVAPLIFTQELLPLLRKTAAQNPPGATRVIWTSSLSLDRFAPRGGVDIAALDKMCRSGSGSQSASGDYAASKAGNWFLALECAKRWGQDSSPGAGDGIVSVTLNPGQIDTMVWKHQPWFVMVPLRPFFVPPKTGAYTMLFAGFSEELGLQEGKNGCYVFPFGRLKRGADSRVDIVKAIEEGRAGDFWSWCEKIAEPYTT